MPPQLQALMQNRNAMIAVILAGVLLFGGIIFAATRGGSSKSMEDQEITKEQRQLALVPNLGKAIEIQALLARKGIHLKQESDGEKTTLFFDEHATNRDRDLALVTLVQSGLMDKNVGLEAFDKGDLTASREEKRIKLIRSQQGELARLIKKIGNGQIDDASVSIAIPEQTLFKSDEKPMSASVQVSLGPGERLTRDEVRAISNLLVGAVQGLDTSHVAITDTNGNTYNSVLDQGSEMSDKLEEQDSYMKQKVSAQLDRLVGAGNYVVTVSTELRQSPKEIMVQQYDPQGAVVNSKQAFNENLNTNGTGPGAGGPTSNMLPNGMSGAMTGGVPNKDYLRNGVEVSYNNSKTQWVETSPVGMVEDISIAVTIDQEHFPNMNMNDLQTLLARAASPKVHPENVSIVQSQLPGMGPIPQSSGPVQKAQDMSWIYWALGTVGVLVIGIFLLSVTGGKGNNKEMDEDFERAQQELAQLRDIASQQQVQIQATQQQTQMLLEAQQRIQQQALEAPGMTADPARQIPQAGSGLQQAGLQQTLDELREVVANEDLEDDSLNLQIKSWIESS